MTHITIILNVHNESNFIFPTLNSISEAAKLALSMSIKVEIILVLDNSDELTKRNIQNFDFESFSSHEIHDVEFSSLSMSRNFGLKKAKGKYVYTADADDLISRNTFTEAFWLAEKTSKEDKFAIFPQYLIAFGEDYYVAKFFDSSDLHVEDFIAGNPYISRIFIKRDYLNKYEYRETNQINGYAFEDWDLVNRLYADDFKFVISPNTILFYRRRKLGLLGTSIETGRMIPVRSSLHEFSHLSSTPKTRFITSGSINSEQDRQEKQQNLAHQLCNSEIISAEIMQAIRLEPTLLFDSIYNSPDYSPYPVQYNHWSKQVISMCRLIGENKFTDVFIAETLNPGGAEKFILQMLKTIPRISERVPKKVLLITTSDALTHEWFSILPEDFHFFDARNAFPNLTELDLQQTLINALLSLCNDGARIHIKTSIFGHNFAHAFINVISHRFQIFYYRFSDSIYFLNNQQFRDGHVIQFLRGTIKKIYRVVTDNKQIIESDRKIFGPAFTEKYFYVNPVVEKNNETWKYHDPNYRLIWASRISWEKRPQLLPLIQQKLRQIYSNLTIDVYGYSDDQELEKLLSRSEGMNYLGPFKNFDEIKIQPYDFFIYTSRFDGAPNVLIEAASTGIPLIVPNVGGIQSIFDSFLDLLVDKADDQEMSDIYVSRIRELYSDWNNTIKSSTQIRDYIRQKYSHEKHLSSVIKCME